MTNIRKRRKSQDSRIKTLFAEIFNFNSYFCKLCMVTVNDIVGKLLKAKYKQRKCQEICQEILEFLAGNIAINKDENRNSSFMKVEALITNSKNAFTFDARTKPRCLLIC